MVRREIANLLFVGSIPTSASTFNLTRNARRARGHLLRVNKIMHQNAKNKALFIVPLFSLFIFSLFTIYLFTNLLFTITLFTYLVFIYLAFIYLQLNYLAFNCM